MQADPALAGLVGSCDGELDAGTILDAIAQIMETDAALLRRELLPVVRELLLDGFLLFA